MEIKYIKIKDLEIPISIKSYRTSKSIKIFFKGNILTITKPTRLSMKRLLETLKSNEEDIYNKYKKITASEISSIKQWQTGDKIYYKGEEYSIISQSTDESRISIKIQESKKEIIITKPENVSQEELKINIDRGIKQLFKKNTEILIADRLPYWSKTTGVE